MIAWQQQRANLNARITQLECAVPVLLALDVAMLPCITTQRQCLQVRQLQAGLANVLCRRADGVHVSQHASKAAVVYA
jgi:hypothetical protein